MLRDDEQLLDLLRFLHDEPQSEPTPPRTRRPRVCDDEDDGVEPPAAPPPATPSISAVNFYGSHVELQDLLRQRKRRGTTEERRRNINVPVWKDFPRQEMAFQYADSDKSEADLNVFSYERVDGVRRFLVSTYEHFWERYVATLPRNRHYYEVIREDSPCHLYLDLEFDRTLSANAALDGEAMVATLCRQLGALLAELYGLEGPGLRQRAVELDSSTERKFSRHLVFQLRAVFHSNHGHLRHFMQLFARRLEAARASDPAVEALYVETDKGTRTPFVDLGVYSRNRVFRLFASSKLGKAAVLWPVTWPSGGELQPIAAHKSMFYRSLVAHVPYNSGKGWRLLPRVPSDGPAPAPRPAGSSSEHWDPSERGNKSSPFPAVDEFVLRAWDALARDCTGAAAVPVGRPVEAAGREGGGRAGGARLQSWSYFAASRVVMYTLAGNRYCANVGRHHRSNGVYLIANLARGSFYQKCFDHECRDFRSNEFPIDPAALPVRPDEPVPEAPPPSQPERDSFGLEYDDDFFAQVDAATARHFQAQAALAASQAPASQSPGAGVSQGEEVSARMAGLTTGAAAYEDDEYDDAFLAELAAFEASVLAARQAPPTAVCS